METDGHDRPRTSANDRTKTERVQLTAQRDWSHTTAGVQLTARKASAQAASVWDKATQRQRRHVGNIHVRNIAVTNPADVRFTPESGHVQCNSVCPLSAKSGHRQPYSITSSARATASAEP